MTPYSWRPSNYLCPECGTRLESRSGPDFISHERCPACDWFEVYDTYEFPSQELERFTPVTDGGRDGRDIEHLRCLYCEDSVTLARIDGEQKLVCHCTHDDGRIKPVSPDSLHHPVIPYGWTFIDEETGQRDPDITGPEERRSDELVGRATYRPPCDAVEHMSPTANMEGLDRRVCPVCRLYFDVGEDSDAVFCSGACKARYRNGVLL